MLRKALEDKSFFPVGSDKEISADFQLIAGTNKDLRIEVQVGRSREDLWARLNTWTFFLPSLIERPEDIAPNFDYELQLATINKQLESSIETVFIMSSHEYSFLSSSSVKEIAKFKRDVSLFVPEIVNLALQEKYK